LLFVFGPCAAKPSEQKTPGLGVLMQLALQRTRQYPDPLCPGASARTWLRQGRVLEYQDFARCPVLWTNGGSE
jgi:hypothetical protein